jgi:acyl-coenzyme A synthetase/AMP-(fatty) acid ligase
MEAVVTDRERVTPFAAELSQFGSTTALVTPDGRALSYAELAEWSADLAERLGPTRRLVLVQTANDLGSIVAYLACLSAGHAALLTNADSPFIAELVERYDPDVVITPRDTDHEITERRIGTCHNLHPDLALLLSTSGSTGSPKLVRLSQENLQSNASAIAQFLRLDENDRAATTLPMAYCYGLSVINSHLSQGASLLVTDLSVVDRCFWEAFKRVEATSFAGVPHTFELLDRVGFESLELPSLRYVTQAGGRLAPEQVVRYAELGRRRGWDLYVMYGQTEATARMAYLPPELATKHPRAVGVPIPGGSFEIAPVDHLPEGEGELIYRGPNVMLGYAHSPDDLALGRTIEALHTGDLGRRTPEGLYEITGRARRFVKPFGLRVDLDRVEHLLAAHGHRALCAGDDRGLAIAVADSVHGTERAVRDLVAGSFGLPRAAVLVRTVETLPRLPTGKPDHVTVGAWLSEGTDPTHPAGAPEAEPAGSLRDELARVLGCDSVTDGDTFASLGGDSLSYVEMSVRIEQALGYLPESWHVTPIGELERLPRRRRGWPALETTVVLRALAMVLVVGSHVGLFGVIGGAHVLLAIAGFNFARFHLDAHDHAIGLTRRCLSSVGRIALPSMAWIAVMYLLSDSYTLANVLLVNNYLADGVWRYWYWFVEVLVQILLLGTLAFSLPSLRRLERRHPLGLAVTVLLVALALRHIPMGDPANQIYRTHSVLWLFALGWVAHRATTLGQKLLLSAAVLIAVPSFFDQAMRDLIVTAGILVVIWSMSIRVPRPLDRIITALAAASLYIYLLHWQVYPALATHLPAALVTVLALLVGVVAWAAVEATRHAITRRRPRWPVSAPHALETLARPLHPVHRVIGVVQQLGERSAVLRGP